MWRAFDRLLPILPPRVLIRWYVSELIADGRHLNGSFHPQFSANFGENNEKLSSFKVVNAQKTIDSTNLLFGQ